MTKLFLDNEPNVYVDIKTVNGKTFAKWDFDSADRFAEVDLHTMNLHHLVNGKPSKTFTFGGWRFWMNDVVRA